MTVLGDNLQDFDPQIERTVEESLPGFNDAFAKTRALVADFQANQAHYRSPSYQEQEVRVDFINKLFVALGWDVNHEKHKNPFEQEVKVERRVNLARAKKRADYAFYAAPNFRDVLFYVEAKKPYVELATADNYFQTIRYGWNSRTPVAILTSFEEFHILDCRLKPNIDTALQRCLGRFHYTEFADPDKFAFIYYLFSREAVANNSIKKFAAELDTRKRTGKQAKQETGIYQDIDESFLDELDDIRQRLARLFKNGNPKLGGETLTEVTQRVVDRLVFIRFLEDKLIEPTDVVSTFGSSSSPWEAFVKASRRLDGIYNGVVFKNHAVLDDADFHADEDEFLAICAELSHANSPYNFDAIPIDILGNIYERFLGKVIVATPKRAIVREKPEVRKSGGVYYTPSYIVNYIVDNTVGRILSGKTPVQIAKMRFADIACGSGSFLLGIYDCLLRYYTKYYNENPTKAPREDCERREEGLHLTLRKKREILLNNIYGVDIDTQATEVAQLSLYLKLMEEETTASAREHQLEFQETLLPPLDRNLVCGNSLVGRDIAQSYALTSSEEIKLNPMDFEDAFPEVMNSGGFDAIVGNPPYLISAGQVYKGYFETHYELSQYQTDNYVYFLERALKKLRADGFLGMIVSDSWIKGKYFGKLRTKLLTETELKSVTVFDYPPFEDATIENSIVISQNRKPRPSSRFTVRQFRTADNLVTINQLGASQCVKTQFIDIHFSKRSSQLIAKLERCPHPLGMFCKINRGVHAYRVDGYGKSKFSEGPQAKRDKEERSYHSTRRIDRTYFPEIKGKDLSRYYYTWDGTYISYGDWLAEPRSPQFFFNPKLAIRKIIGPRLVCTFIESTMILDQSIYVCIRDSGDPPHLLFLLAILASRIGAWYIQKKYGVYDKLYPWFTKEQLDHFPIPELNFNLPSVKEHHDTLVHLAESMLEAKRNLMSARTDKESNFWTAKCDSLDRQIDSMVFALYGLSEEDIRALSSETADTVIVPG